MPVEVLLHLEGVRRPALRRLAECPGLGRLLNPDRPPLRLEVSALALEEDFYVGEHALAPDDEAFLEREGVNREGPAEVLMPADLVPFMGANPLAATPRRSFLRFLARVARETGDGLVLSYDHERGDWPYESATWTFGPRESLEFADYDGGPNVLRRARAQRGAREEEPRFGVLAGLLREVKIPDK